MAFLLIVPRILILVGLIRLLVRTDKPLLCAGIYGGINGFLLLFLGVPYDTATLHAAISFVIAAAYFGLLTIMAYGSFLWWFIAAAGALVGLV